RRGGRWKSSVDLLLSPGPYPSKRSCCGAAEPRWPGVKRSAYWEVAMMRMSRRHILAGAAGLLAAGRVFPARAAEFVNVLTGGTSGVYYPLGVALSKIYGDKIPDVRTQVQATKASVENLNLLQDEKGEIAFALGDSVKLGWEGDAEAGFKQKLDKLRGIAAIYPNFIQIVASK